MGYASTENAVSIEHEGAVEELRERIAVLVAQRQQLRAFGASRAWLEQNRLQLGRSQRDLCRALIDQHLPALPA